jgi:hypothetical protein
MRPFVFKKSFAKSLARTRGTSHERGCTDENFRHEAWN